MFQGANGTARNNIYNIKTFYTIVNHRLKFLVRSAGYRSHSTLLFEPHNINNKVLLRYSPLSIKNNARFLLKNSLSSLPHPNTFAISNNVGSTRVISSFIPKIIAKTIKFPAYIGGGAAAISGYLVYKLEEARDFASDKLATLKDFMDGVGSMLKGNGDGENENNGGGNGDNDSESSLAGATLIATLTDTEKGQEEAKAGSNQEGDEEEEEEEETVDTTQDDMVNLTKQMIEIRSILNKIDSSSSNLTLPSIVVIGSQSSGKSSVLESIVGKEFLPKGSNMVTRRPIELTLVNTPNNRETTADFPTMRMYNIKDFLEVKKILTDLNLAVPSSECISEDPIQLTIKSPTVPDLSMVDLPGYIQIEAADQPIELKSKIRQLCNKYLAAPNIILAISPADVDLANSTALKASRQVDPAGERTIGVVTKLDMVSLDEARKILTNKKYPLKMGYVGVINRPPISRATTTAAAARRFFGNEQPTTGDSKKNSLVNVSSSASPSDYENQYFKTYKDYFSKCEVSSRKLRSKLIKILEVSMSNALEPTEHLIQQDLDDTSYRFKVEFNDRQLTPKSYLLSQIDIIKSASKELQEQFSRSELKSILKADLDQKVLEILANRYWKETGLSYGSGATVASEVDDVYWHKKLELASSSLTKIGVGRLSTTLVTNAILKELDNVLDFTTGNETDGLIRQLVNNTAINVLNSKYYSTADQVENCIKPFKYEIELEDRDWNESRDHSIALIKEEYRQCAERFSMLKSSIGSSKLQQVTSYLNKKRAISNSIGTTADAPLLTEETLGFSKLLLERGQEAIQLDNRIKLLQFRLKILKKKCQSSKDSDRCPEVFLNAVSDKLTSTAVLFLNVELLSDFFYNFPIELDKRVSLLNNEQIEMYAKEDSRIARHIELQKRKELLELALNKIDSILVFRKTYRGYQIHK
ncbi:related to Dynamin-like GTPase MGM1, mitochondrial [Saccharomycodes ludwigii]|uniref:dynamin GTPase n=1 Tax=Saccharomycodes ludwigii TaxID=36035 RepID=A0A376B9D9_9ASCO|nr:hypothetical protein SCDLUD_002105 [Saccharomycodes ludwigii]KAH3902287.1 hypothetical protein SCDLUD_002105 [Saccharomycodes ludwigii]SSD60740.1 related to Dynamin-like GTPase MGM1, mitochondrial [Saccharomycodes ludwigii]